MRILQLGKYWHPQRGGMETLLQQYSEGLVRRGHRVRVLVSAIDGGESQEMTEAGVELWRCARYGELASLPICPSLPGAVRRSMVDFQPEVVHLHLPNPLAAASWLVLGRARPLVVTYHSDIVRQRGLLRFWSPWRDRVLARARYIHTTSDALIQTSPVLARYPERCRAIPPGVDSARWTGSDPDDVAAWRERIGQDAFLFVGRLVYYKGLDVLLEAIRGTDLRVAICGDGPLRAELQERARELGGSVVFLGDVDAGRMSALYSAARAFVLPSVAPSETFGVVQLEAMAARLPLVVSRASAGVVSVHEGANSALLVESGSPEALRSAMLRVRDEPGLAMRLVSAGAELVRSRYALEERLDELEELLVCAGRSTAA